MISVTVAGFALNPVTKEPVMLLKRTNEADPVKRLVPVVLGPVEAHAIIIALQGSEQPRPMTHDLLANVMATLQAELVRVDIHNFREGTFFASLTFNQAGVTFVLDARPSDAVALAVRIGVPVFMHPAVFVATSVETNIITASAGSGAEMPIPMERVLAEIHNFAENVQPSDFK